MSAPSSSSLTGTGSAPGRLDVLGGVADYSGSHVLQMSIAAQTHVSIKICDGDMIIVKSTGRDDVQIAWKEIDIHLKHTDLIDACTSLRTYLRTTTLPHWSYYVLGSILAYVHVMSWHPSNGLHLTITSDVPEGMGVSSSAAIEVATIRALEDLALKTSPSSSRFTGTHLARTAQLVENHVAGAPCGLMDQLASAYGAHGALLPIMCRPDVLYPLVQLPKGVCVVGWCSGVKHSIGASPYAIARCASFMGKAILSRQLSRTWTYSTEITPSLFAAHQHLLPINMTGAEYLKEYHSVNDSQSHIIPEITYPIRAAISFPIHENYRVQVATELLRSCCTDDTSNRTHILSLVGELLYQSHAGYSSMGLGCATTDAMVSQLMTLGVEHGIYGARISGGGSGGTVVVLCTTDAVTRVDQLRRDLPSSHNLPLIR